MPNEFTYDNNKQILRKELAKKRAALSGADSDAFSKIIAERVCSMVHGNVLVYISIGREVKTDKLVNLLLERKDVALFAPYTVGTEIYPLRLRCIGKADKHGNLAHECYIKEDFDAMGENKPIKQDYCITPLLGFNCKGFRIGYGMGCYDRYLAGNAAYRIGLAYSFQEVSFVPDKHDVPLDCCVTEKKVIYF